MPSSYVGARNLNSGSSLGNTYFMPRTESSVLRVMLTKLCFSLTKELLLVLNNPSTALDGQYEEVQTIKAPRRAAKENMLNLKLTDLK